MDLRTRKDLSQLFALERLAQGSSCLALPDSLETSTHADFALSELGILGELRELPKPRELPFPETSSRIEPLVSKAHTFGCAEVEGLKGDSESLETRMRRERRVVARRHSPNVFGSVGDDKRLCLRIAEPLQHSPFCTGPDLEQRALIKAFPTRQIRTREPD